MLFSGDAPRNCAQRSCFGSPSLMRMIVPCTSVRGNRTLYDAFEEERVLEGQRKHEELRQQEERARSKARRTIALSQMWARHDIEDEDDPDFDSIA